MEVLNRLPWEAQNSVFERLAKIADISAMSKADRDKYDESIKKYRDTINVMEGAIEKGYKKGRNEMAQNIAGQLKAMGMSFADIQKATGLPAEEIEKLFADTNDKE